MFTSIEAREFFRYTNIQTQELLRGLGPKAKEFTKTVLSTKVGSRLLLGGVSALLGLSADQQANWQQDIISDLDSSRILASPKIDSSEEIMSSSDSQISATGEIEIISGSDGVKLTRFSGTEGHNKLPVLIIPRGWSSEDAALTASQNLVGDLGLVKPLPDYINNMVLYMHNQAALPDLQCYRDFRGIPICSPDKVTGVIEHAMKATGKTILEGIVLWNVETLGAGSTINLDGSNPPSYRSFAVVAISPQRHSGERKIAANEIGKSIFDLTEEFIVSNEIIPVGNVFFNCRENVSIWIGLPGNPGTQFEGCYTQKKGAYRTSEKNILRDLGSDTFGPLNSWYIDQFSKLVPGNYNYPPLQLYSLREVSAFLGLGLPQGSLDLGIKLDIPLGATQLAIEAIAAPDSATGQINSPSPDRYVGTVEEIEHIRKNGFIFPAPKLSEGNYALLPNMTYTWRVRWSPLPYKLPFQDPRWEILTIRPMETISVPAQTRKDHTPARGSEKISFPVLGNGETTNNLTPTLRWQDGNSDVFYYEVQLSKDSTFNTDPQTATAAVQWNLIHGGMTNPLNSYRAAPLEAGTTYFWRVRPRVQGDGPPAEWSSVANFKTAPDATAKVQSELEVITMSNNVQAKKLISTDIRAVEAYRREEEFVPAA